MQRTVAIALLVVLAAVPAGVGGVAAQETVDCSFPVSETDATGTTVTVDEEPETIVATAPSAAQTAWAIGAQDRVEGMPVNPYTSYLEGYDEREHVVDDQGQPVRESVVALQPDLVLAPNITSPDAVDGLRDAGLTVYHFHEAQSLEDVSNKTELTGQLVGEFENASNVSAQTRGTVDAVESAVDGEDEPTVYYAMGGGWTAGTDTFIHELITTAGGHNVAEDAGIEGYDSISQEVLVNEDPEYLILSEGMPVPDTPAVQNSTAVEQGNIVRVDANYLNQAGPRNVEPLITFATAFHGDVVDESTLRNAAPAEQTRCASAVANDDNTTTPTTATQDGAAESTATPADGGDSEGAIGPGFGVVAAVLALLSVALLARRP